MAPLPVALLPFWDITDNFDSAGHLITAETYNGPNDYVASWNCPTCSDFWKATIASMKQRICKHQAKYGIIRPCKFCNIDSDKGNWDAHGAKRCHIDGRDTIEALYPNVAAQWATITIDGITYSLNKVEPDEIVPGKQHIYLRCNQPVDAHGKLDLTSGEECRHVRSVRIRTACNPGGGRSAHGCGSCSEGGNDVNNYDGRNALTNTNPEMAQELLHHPNGLTAVQIKPGSDAMCRWRCEQTTYGSICHHEWDAQVNPRTGRSTPGYRSDCPACRNDVVHEDGRNSLATLFPHMALDWNYELNTLTPDEVCPGWSSDRIGEVHWRCTQVNDNGTLCLNEWPTPLYSRTQCLQGFGHLSDRFCPVCNPGSGFNDARVGYYYSLRITGPTFSIVKNGITNAPRSRMLTLSYSLNEEYEGWHYTLESLHRHPPSPVERYVRNLETSLLQTEAIRVAALSFDGGTELFTLDAFAYAEGNGMVESDEWEDVSEEMEVGLNAVLHRYL